MSKPAVAFLLLCLAQGAAAAEPEPASLFGVAIGTRIEQLPECSAPEGEGKICRHASKADSEPQHETYIELRPERPKFMKTNLVAGVKGGVIESISVETGGLQYQEEILAILTRRFGKPRSLKWHSSQNLLGANFKHLEADWSPRQGGSLLFNAVTESIDNGYIFLSK